MSKRQHDVVVPVILCGGSGTRLWPLSRKSYPKQFSRLFGDESLFKATARRLSGAGFARPVIVTSADFRFIVEEELQAIGVEPAAIIIEPEPRNTAPAVLAAALWIRDAFPGATMLVAPSDHLIPNPEEFRRAVAEAGGKARLGALVTFGIVPSRPETGYGYLEIADGTTVDVDGMRPLTDFVEKPDSGRALAMVASGRFLWNAGIFLFATASVIGNFTRLAPAMSEAVGEAMRRAKRDRHFLCLDAESWRTSPSESIDYAIMEKAENLWVKPYHGGWSDLGGWEAVWSESSTDDAGVATQGRVTAIDCHDSLLRSEDARVELVGIGLKDVVAIAMADAVLVADKSHVQDVKAAVAAMKMKSVQQAETFPRDYRPWGWFESLILQPGFQVKRIVVKPGAALSLQSHKYRAEHWVVVEGTADVTIDESRHQLAANTSIYIPLGAKHRLANPGTAQLTVIEVQTGSYLGEDDIVRYEDVYARS